MGRQTTLDLLHPLIRSVTILCSAGLPTLAGRLTKISFASSSREFKETLNRIIFGSYGFFDDLKNSQSAGLECEFPAAYHFFLNQPNGE
jgi:hypothetical protein